MLKFPFVGYIVRKSEVHVVFVIGHSSRTNWLDFFEMFKIIIFDTIGRQGEIRTIYSKLDSYNQPGTYPLAYNRTTIKNVDKIYLESDKRMINEVQRGVISWIMNPEYEHRLFYKKK